MAMSSVPYALQNATHNANLFRQAVASGIPPGGGIVTPGDFTVTQTGTPSMAVIVGVGRIWIPGTEVANVTGGNFSSQSMYYAENESADTRTVATSDPTNPRIDVVYAYVKDQAYSGTLNVSDYAVATGVPTPGATYPTNAPTLPNNALALAWINVPAGASSIINSNITQLAIPYSLRHVELTGSTSPTANTLWGPAALSFDTANSINYSWCTIPSSDRVQLTPGSYQVFIRYSLSVNSSGTTWGAIVNDGNTVTYTSTDMPAGYATIAVQTPLLIKTTQNVRFTFITGTSGATLTSRVRILKVA
jgi:hypothetical protein